MDNLFIIVLIAFGIGLYVYSTRSREAAFRAAEQACQDSQVQNLDGYVALKKISFGRTPDNKLALLKRYQFEFTTTGSKRYLGYIVMDGRHPVIVEMESSE